MFQDRAQAGRLLAEGLESSRRSGTLVVGLARGGVPVAHEVALALGAPLEALEVRRLTLPGPPQAVLGARAEGGGLYLLPSIWALESADRQRLEAMAQEQAVQLARGALLLREARPLPSFQDRRVILVDDGLVTGIAMAAAADAVRRGGARAIIGAAPVASTAAIARLERLLDEVVCPVALDKLESVAGCYLRYPPVSELDLHAMLWSASRPPNREDAAGA